MAPARRSSASMSTVAIRTSSTTLALLRVGGQELERRRGGWGGFLRSIIPLLRIPLSAPGGTCCGDACYAGLQFAMNGSALQSLLRPNTCVSASPDGSAMSIAACDASDPKQAFAYSVSTGALSQGAKCLTAPPPAPPPVAYMTVCSRIGSYNSAARRAAAAAGVSLGGPAAAPRSGVPSAPGYCLSVDDTGAWNLFAGGSSLASGSLGAFVPNAPHQLVLSTVGNAISGSINGSALFNTTDSRYASGFVGLGSSFTAGVAFDDFSVHPPALA